MYSEMRECGCSSDRAGGVTLREHGAQPGAQAAAAVEVLEQRSTLTTALDEAEELAV
jgi:hypothetical protein